MALSHVVICLDIDGAVPSWSVIAIPKKSMEMEKQRRLAEIRKIITDSISGMIRDNISFYY